MQGLIQKTLVGAVIAALIYAAFAIWADASAVLNSVTNLSPSVFIGALALTLVNYAIRFGKWSLMLHQLQIDVPPKLSLVTFLAGMSMSITPGKLGEVLKSALLRQSLDLPVARTAPVVFAERLTDLLGLVIIAAAGIATFDYGRIPLAITAASLLALVVVLQKPALVHRLLGLCSIHPSLEGLRMKLDETYEATRTLLAWPALATTTALSVLSWGMEAAAFFWIVSGLGGESSFLMASFVYAMTTILGAVSFLPGGLGVTEGSMIGVLRLLGVFKDLAPATASTYLIRLATLWFGVALGFIALGIYRTRFQNTRRLTDGSAIH